LSRASMMTSQACTMRCSCQALRHVWRGSWAEPTTGSGRSRHARHARLVRDRWGRRPVRDRRRPRRPRGHRRSPAPLRGRDACVSDRRGPDRLDPPGHPA
jgi:hypothetical protein